MNRVVLKQFAWEQWDDQTIAVIFRYVKDRSPTDQMKADIYMDHFFFKTR